MIACKNYDGDIISEIVATGFGSRNNMINQLVGYHGEAVFEANHGTVTKHY